MNWSIEKIINDFGASILKICIGYSNSTEDAKDLYQEVLLNIWKGIKTFRNDSSIKTWIYRIAINTCLLSHRKKRINTVPFDPIKHDYHNSIESFNQSNSQLDILIELIRKLPEKDKSIMILYMENLSYQEISKVIGISVSNVGVKVNRIKIFLIKKVNNNE